MLRFLGRRLAVIPFVLIGASIVVFMMMHLAPGDPAQAMLGPMASPAELQRLRVALGLTEPLYQQYWDWLIRAVHGNLGQSIYFKDAVVQEVVIRLGATGFLVLCSFIFAAVFGTIFGFVSAAYRNTVIDRMILGIATLGISFPPFYLGMLLIMVFALTFHVLPMSGLTNITGTGGFLTELRHVILPSIALGAGPLTVIARMMRSSVLEEMGHDYIRTARAKGLKTKRILVKHVLKNALIPTVDLLGLQVGYLASSTALVEVVFSWPGIGNLLITSITNRDLPLTQGIVLVLTVTYVVVNLVTDIAHASLDPRLRYE